MSEAAAGRMPGRRPRRGTRLRRRHAAERRFRLYGLAGICFAVAMLGLLLVSVAGTGVSGFRQTQLRLAVSFDPAVLGQSADREILRRADYGALVRQALLQRFPEVRDRREVRRLSSLASTGAADRLRQLVLDDPGLVGSSAELWLPASDDVDMLAKGRISAEAPEAQRTLGDRQIAWVEALRRGGDLRTAFNWDFLRSGDSREPELAGVWGAMVGSFLALAVTLVAAFPTGVMAALYLEAFAPRNRWTAIVEVNINNLAAVPSIVFGLLGLAFFLGLAGLPRSAPLVGGLTLALMTLPTIIIAGRAALKAVPPSVRDAALALGASPTQAVLHHVLPLAMPGMLTGTIIGMARALGETAPLLMIGMVAFIPEAPAGLRDPATALPVQIFLWADSPERAFVEKTSAAILVLLAFLVAMNGAAIYLRQRFEQRW